MTAKRHFGSSRPKVREDGTVVLSDYVEGTEVAAGSPDLRADEDISPSLDLPEEDQGAPAGASAKAGDVRYTASACHFGHYFKYHEVYRPFPRGFGWTTVSWEWKRC